ncbi:hypothetical protein D3867_28510 (plasmid) [Azospirillum argentinense]|uniref:MarR family transcriptional regulator n=2 Tax=Azospirillaceae TaxID=2829815 RepID=A0A4D8Q6Z7_AZOBR|nr:hypothetical protein D3867_28510 [Azospirillum argentinense]UKJ76812.1 hypothetical protein H1Q64_24185 [Azospirillum brasilense]
MISPTSVNWTMLNTLRAMPGPEATTPPVSLLAITKAASLKPAAVRPALCELVRQGFVQEYATQCGKQYARTKKGNQRILEIKGWLR